MKNELLTKGIILPSGEIGKDKINLVAGAITQPFAEMVWVSCRSSAHTPFHSEGLGHFPTGNFQPTRRSAGGRKYGKGTPFLCLLRNFLPLSLLHGKSDFAKAGQKKNAANCDVSNCFFYEETRELYSPVISLLASSIPFAVADRIFKSFSLMPLSMVSS